MAYEFGLHRCSDSTLLHILLTSKNECNSRLQNISQVPTTQVTKKWFQVCDIDDCVGTIQAYTKKYIKLSDVSMSVAAHKRPLYLVLIFCSDF